MDEAFLAIIRDVGPVGILALALLGVARGLRPALEAVAQAQRDSADARREQSKTNEAVLKRWEDSDSILDGHSRAFADAMRAVTEELRDLKIVDTQRIKQNDVTAAQINGAREDIRALAKDFAAGKDAAVHEVAKAMDDKLKPIEMTLQSIQRQVSEALELLHTVAAAERAADQAAAVEAARPEAKAETEAGAADAEPANEKEDADG